MKCVAKIVITLLCLCSLLGSAFASESTLTWVEDGVWYEKNTQMFVYSADENELVRSSVADGMITTKMVSVNAHSSAKLRIYRDGELLDEELYRQLGDPGEYVVMYHNGSEEKRILSFAVIPAVTNSAVSYRMPEGFEIVQATLDNVPTVFEADYICFSEEGDYRVLYRCIRTGMNYSLNFTTDFTGPVLKLENVSDGMAQGPVDISDAREAYSVQIFKDGEPIEYTDTLSASGDYLICLEDSSGNATSYEFTILIYFNSTAWVMLGGAALLLAGLIVYMVLSRKKLTVR